MKRCALLLLVGALLSACGGAAQPTVLPTVDPDAVATQVSKQLTQMPTATQVVIPTQPPAPTLAPANTTAPTQQPTTAPTSAVTAEPTAGPTLSPTAAPIPIGDPRSTLGQPTWQDTLENGRNFLVYTDEHVKIEENNGALRLTSLKADGWHSWTLSYPELTDFYIEANIRPATCSGADRYGLVLRAEESDTAYLAGLTCDGKAALLKWEEGELSRLTEWTTNAAIKTGADQPNRLGMMVRGDQLTLYVNGVQAAHVSDDDFDKGTFGFFTAGFNTEGFAAGFEDVAYWTLP